MTAFDEDARWAALFARFTQTVVRVAPKANTAPLSGGTSFTLSEDPDDYPHLFLKVYGDRMVAFCDRLELDMCPIMVEATYLCMRGFQAVIYPHAAMQTTQRRSTLIIHLWCKGHRPHMEVA